MIKDIAGVILIIFGYLDAIKYHFQSQKIKQAKTAIGNSRKFINLAIINDFYRFFYFIFIDNNYYVLITAILALIFMLELYWNIYIFYPYKQYPKSKTTVLKRPNIILYIYNSLLPNKIRRHL